MAEIHVEKKSNPWPWIIGLIVLALIIWAVIEMMDNDVDDTAYVGTDTAVVAPVAVDDDPDVDVIDNEPMDTMPTPATPELTNMVGATRVYFPLDHAVLTDDARARLDAIANEVRDAPDREIVVAGYTDTTGTRPYNQELSEDRAEQVRQYLVEHGVAEDRITLESHGQTNLLVETGDGVIEQDNRRVRIEFGDEI